jgi:amino-acid N-acetyltransferase
VAEKQIKIIKSATSVVNHEYKDRIFNAMKISFATAGNEPEIKQLLAASELHHDDLDSSQLKNFILAWEGSKLVGVVGLEIKADCALLRSLAVDAVYRNRKIATGLVKGMENYAKSLQLSRLYLLTMTAEEFFSRRGFRKTDRNSAPAGIQQTTEFKNLCPASAICMVKHLPDGLEERNITLNGEL